MEKVCPCCNSLMSIDIKCRTCEDKMFDKGRSQEALSDDYTANMPINDAEDYCVHYFECQRCMKGENIKINKITI